MPFLVEGISKSYKQTSVLRSVGFECADGEFFSILGKSGSGKTTLLRIVAGLERADSGTIRLNEKDISSLLAHERKMAMVFQNYALFPHLSVFENVAFGLREQKKSFVEIKRIVNDNLSLLNIADKALRMPAELSGGEQQRVAIARALAVESPITLFDEPLSNLDIELRKAMQKELKSIQRKTKRTFIYITHDQEEALMLSDKLLILSQGKVCEYGAPEDIYERPKSLFGASFIGSANVLEANLENEFSLISASGLRLKSQEKLSGKRFYVAIRPEHIEAIEQDAKDEINENTFKATVLERFFKGATYEHLLAINGEKLTMTSNKPLLGDATIRIRKFFVFPSEA